MLQKSHNIRTKYKSLLPLIALFASGITNAGTLTCGGTVEELGLHASDMFMVRLSSMNKAVFVCNPNQQWNVTGTPYTTSAETCKLMMSMFMHAKTTREDMGSVWFDGDSVPESCNQWDSWKSANIRYFLY